MNISTILHLPIYIAYLLCNVIYMPDFNLQIYDKRAVMVDETGS